MDLILNSTVPRPCAAEPTGNKSTIVPGSPFSPFSSVLMISLISTMICRSNTASWKISMCWSVAAKAQPCKKQTNFCKQFLIFLANLLQFLYHLHFLIGKPTLRADAVEYNRSKKDRDRKWGRGSAKHHLEDEVEVILYQRREFRRHFGRFYRLKWRIANILRSHEMSSYFEKEPLVLGLYRNPFFGNISLNNLIDPGSIPGLELDFD